jgi:hypothetical protein
LDRILTDNASDSLICIKTFKEKSISPYKKLGEVADHALHKAASHDPLTNILNHGAFMSKAQQELGLSK